MFFEPSLGVPHCRHFQKTPLSESLGSAGLSLCAKHGCMAEIGPGWASVWFVTGLRLQVLLVIVAASIPKNVPSKPMLSAFCHGNGWSMWDEVNANLWPYVAQDGDQHLPVVSFCLWFRGHWIGGQSHMAVVSALDKLGYPQVFRSFSDRFPIVFR